MKAVAIIGKAPNAAQAPAGMECWGCNDCFLRFGLLFDAWDRWFDLHTRGHIRKHRPHAWEWYATRDGRRPIYLHESDLEIVGSVAYPLRAVQDTFAWGGHSEEFFAGSVDYMLALAILEGFERIALYGVDMADSHERERQRDGAHYWIGIARGRGIDVVIPDESSLCKTERLYGYYTETSSRNFASMSVTRFLRQIHAAQALEKGIDGIPGIDEGRSRTLTGIGEAREGHDRRAGMAAVGHDP